MMETASGYLNSTVSDEHLDEIKEDLQDSSNELVGYYHDSENGDISVILDLTNLNASSRRYIH